RCGLIRAAYWRRLYLFASHSLRIDRRREVIYLSHVGDQLHARMELSQHLPRDHSGRDPANRFASGRTATALPIANAVLSLVGEIGVGRTKDLLHLLIGFGTRILVADQDG